MSHVFILGAGATAGYTAEEPEVPPPVAGNFLKATAALCNAGRLKRAQFDTVWQFIERHYRIAFEQLDTRTVDIEELLTLVDLSGNAALRRSLVRLIVLTLHKILWGYECPHHSRLLSSLGPEDAVITFNWDLLLDNIAHRHFAGPDYGAQCLQVSGRQEQPGTRSPLVLKLHGSFNWMTCLRCRHHRAELGQGKIAAHAEQGNPAYCPECPRAMQPVMIYPTLFKKYDSPVLTEVWERARCVLRSAKEVTIIGYSLPPTDFAAKWLFMETSAERPRPLERLTIVDLCPTPLRDKFASAFHVPTEHVRLVTGGIAQVPQP